MKKKIPVKNKINFIKGVNNFINLENDITINSTKNVFN